jgi:hypothetical protein
LLLFRELSRSVLKPRTRVLEFESTCHLGKRTMIRIEMATRFALRVVILALVAGCVSRNTSGVERTDEGLVAIEAQLAAGGSNTALCVEYIGLCEQGLSLCLASDNAVTYADFCSSLQSRCRTTTDLYCGAPKSDAGVPVPVDAGTSPPAGPTISAVSASDLTQTTATVSWTLNQPATGEVEYGTTTFYGNRTTKELSFNYSAHVQHLSGLTAGTVYHFRVRSTNQAGAESVSGDHTFTTAGGVPTQPDGGYHAPPPTSSLVVNVRNTGAVGNGIADDTAAIQNAVNQVGGTGGTVLVPAGTYMVNVAVSVVLKSNMTLKLDAGATLKAIPTALGGYDIVKLQNLTNVNVVGGRIQGERHQHLVPGNFANTIPNQNGEWGYGISVYAGSNIFIDGVAIAQCWGDGILVGEGSGPARNVTVANVFADDNRRQGLSVTWADGIVIRDSTFNNTAGAWPQSGIDLEPSRSTASVTNVKILNNTMNNNATGVTHGNPGPDMHISNVVISCNTMKDNRLSGIRKTSAASNEVVSNNTISGSPYPITSTGDVTTVIAQNGGNDPSRCPVP